MSFFTFYAVDKVGCWHILNEMKQIAFQGGELRGERRKGDSGSAVIKMKIRRHSFLWSLNS